MLLMRYELDSEEFSIQFFDYHCGILSNMRYIFQITASICILEEGTGCVTWCPDQGSSFRFPQPLYMWYLLQQVLWNNDC